MKFARNTVQRQIVLDTVKKLNTHPSIEEIYAFIHREHPSISKSTVYRNLKHLEEGGNLRHISMPEGPSRYDATCGRHYHFRCKGCDRIFDVKIAYLEGINDMVQSLHGFDVGGHDVVFTGICATCKNIKNLKGEATWQI